MDILGLDQAMESMSGALTERGPVKESLKRIVDAAVETVPGADYSSITVRHADGRLDTVVATDDLVLRADELQYALNEGPCYDAVTTEQVTCSVDLAHDEGWPRFGPKVAELGLSSQMGLRLSNEPTGITGLNLYARERAAFDQNDQVARLFASHARVALGFANQLQSLQGALDSREAIGKAIGIIMERYRISDERAFEFLIRLSQNSNTKLRDLAADVVRTTPTDG